MIKLIRFFAFTVIFLSALALCVGALDFPNVNENGTVVGLTSYDCPLSSDNTVEVFNNNEELNASKTNKFSVSAVQGSGEYFAEVYRRNGIKLSDLSLSFEPYFAAISFFGEPIMLNIAMHTDVENGYSVYSNKGIPSASFDDGILSVAVDQAQIIKVVFDDSVGKTLYILVEYMNSLTPFDIESLLNSGINTVTKEGDNGYANYTYPLKTVIDNNIVYYPAVYSKGNAYLSCDLYNGVYNGNDTVSFKGDIYIPIDSFVGNGGFVSASYDNDLGIIKLESNKASYASITGFESAAGSVLTENGEFITFYNNNDSVSKGIFARITKTSLINYDCLKLTFRSSMTGLAAGAKLSLAVVGYNAQGVTDVISEDDARAYSKSCETTSYFDISSVECAYEGVYIVIIIEEAPEVTVTMSNIKLEVFEISSELGDNEFNPF